ncbi:MAG: sugar phosphate isomerase/epimerase [Candidatus Omnitrophica bacterium]|nr:sugar phosphate isomerase/epimerase [Candidatus Omnitrophota bacterium]
MRTCSEWPVSVCSWSFQKDIADVAQAMKDLDIGYINLALLPALQEDGADYLKFIKAQDWTISSTMINFPSEDYSTLDAIKVSGGIAPDNAWEQNRELTLGAIRLTAELGAEYLLMHFGFIDHSNPDYVKKFYDRTQILADAAAENGVKFLMETGQETAEELKHFLEEINHPALCVNFDPANMILYDKGVPTEAIKVLTPWIRHIHIKDATRTLHPGSWGAEVPWGQGEVNDILFLETLKEIGYQGAVAIEREAGDDRFGDIKMAAEKLSQFSA